MISRMTLLLSMQVCLCLMACGGGNVQVSSNGTTTGTSGSSSATAPSITTQPTAQSVVLGQPATFTVTATGTAPLSYQWQKGGAPISGATGASYTTPATAQSDSGSTFTVVVTDAAGSVTSNSAALNVTAPTPAKP